ncbi:MAG: hypothetical protein RL120_12185, partial [Gammaproteobacteria bacterium]
LDTAEEFFRYLLASDSPPARAWSGLGDSLRFQDTDTSDEEIARYFETARETAPGDLHILLDYGEYWESELAQCDREFGPERVQQLEAVVFESFESAYRLSPGHPEVNLALGEAYLFPGRDWQQGRAFQQRAFQMLPADTYVMEQAAKYAIAAGDYDEAQRLIEELAQPMHFYGEPPWVTQLRGRLESRMRGREFDACANE